MLVANLNILGIKCKSIFNLQILPQPTTLHTCFCDDGLCVNKRSELHPFELWGSSPRVSGLNQLSYGSLSDRTLFLPSNTALSPPPPHTQKKKKKKKKSSLKKMGTELRILDFLSILSFCSEIIKNICCFSKSDFRWCQLSMVCSLAFRGNGFIILCYLQVLISPWQYFKKNIESSMYFAGSGKFRRHHLRGRLYTSGSGVVLSWSSSVCLLHGVPQAKSPNRR